MECAITRFDKLKKKLKVAFLEKLNKSGFVIIIACIKYFIQNMRVYSINKHFRERGAPFQIIVKYCDRSKYLKQKTNIYLLVPY